jgi:hypothetical protein
MLRKDHRIDDTIENGAFDSFSLSLLCLHVGIAGVSSCSLDYESIYVFLKNTERTTVNCAFLSTGC